MRESALQPGVLAGISGGDATFERELLALFIRATERDAVLLEVAVQERARERTEAIAHLVQGRCKTIGATAVARGAERVEHAAAHADWRAIIGAHLEFATALAALRDEVDGRFG
jgi:thiamine monophosphate synthase